MITKYISCKKIIGDFYRDVKPNNSDWVYNCIEWIHFGLGELGGGFNLELKSIDVEVENHRANLPCNIASLKQIVYNNNILPKYNTINIEQYDLSNLAFWNELSANYIRTSFEEGTITMYYYTIASEYDKTMGISFPLIPDDGAMQVRNYLQEYILMKWLAQGNSHPVRAYAEVKSGIYYQFGSGAGLLQRAKNSISFPSTYDLDSVQKVFTNLKRDWQRHKVELYNNSGVNAGGDVETPNDFFLTNNQNV